MPVSCSIVFHTQVGPPKAKLELSISVWPGSAVWPGSPRLVFGQLRIGTSLSRGRLMTTAPRWLGRMCRIIMVSERWPWTYWPNFLLLPDRLSEPTSRMFSDEVYAGGRAFPRLAVLNVSILCTVFR